MLNGSAELHQFISKSVVNPPVCQEVHQVVIEGLKNNTAMQVLNTAIIWLH